MMMMQQRQLLQMQRQPWLGLQRLCTPPTSGGASSPALLHLLPPRPPSSPASFSIRAPASSSSSSSSTSSASKFEGTRHNVGFETIAEAEGIPLRTIHHKALLGKGAGSRIRTSVISNSSMLRGSPVLGADLKGLLVPGHVWQKRDCRGGIRCQAATASSAQGPADANAPSAPDVKLAQIVRAVFFYLTTITVAIPLFVVMLVIQPFVLLFDKQRRRAQHLVNKVWATVTTSLFYNTEIEGWENLPAADEGAVYVANHQSFLDIYTLFQLGRPFKFISKTSNFLIPIIGWSMFMTGHIPLKRMDKRSQLECLKKCMRLVKEGVSVLFFPEGTRTTDGAMAAFKKGAFSVAAKGGVPVVPITLIGSGKLMPNGLEYTLRPGLIKVIVHPPIRSNNADELCNQSRQIIAETLIKHGLPVH